MGGLDYSFQLPFSCNKAFVVYCSNERANFDDGTVVHCQSYSNLKNELRFLCSPLRPKKHLVFYLLLQKIQVG